MKISGDISEAERAQDQANDNLEAAGRDRDKIKDQIQNVRYQSNPNIRFYAAYLSLF